MTKVKEKALNVVEYFVQEWLIVFVFLALIAGLWGASAAGAFLVGSMSYEVVKHLG